MQLGTSCNYSTKLSNDPEKFFNGFETIHQQTNEGGGVVKMFYKNIAASLGSRLQTYEHIQTLQVLMVSVSYTR